MMSVLEYANDVGVSTSHILNLCEKLNLSATNKDDMLSEDDIIMLDDEISLEDKEIEVQRLNTAKEKYREQTIEHAQRAKKYMDIYFKSN